jgi:hypothetical protein
MSTDIEPMSLTEWTRRGLPSFVSKNSCWISTSTGTGPRLIFILVSVSVR